MTSRLLIPLAAVTLGGTNYLWSIVDQPGTQIWASLGAGFLALVTIRLIVAAARADLRERLEQPIRSEADR